MCNILNKLKSDCLECRGIGLYDRYLKCPKCKGTGRLFFPKYKYKANVVTYYQFKN